MPIDRATSTLSPLDRACRKAYWRLPPLLFLCYVVAYDDRAARQPEDLQRAAEVRYDRDRPRRDHRSPAAAGAAWLAVGVHRVGRAGGGARRHGAAAPAGPSAPCAVAQRRRTRRAGNT